MDSTVDDGRHARLRPASPIAEVTRLGVTTAHATLGVGRFLLDTAFDAAHLRAHLPASVRVEESSRALVALQGPGAEARSRSVAPCGLMFGRANYLVAAEKLTAVRASAVSRNSSETTLSTWSQSSTACGSA